jgi:hypothetical protein
VIARDWAGVLALLAPWLQSSLSVDDVRAFYEDAYREVLEENGVEGCAILRNFTSAGIPR